MLHQIYDFEIFNRNHYMLKQYFPNYYFTHLIFVEFTQLV